MFRVRRGGVLVRLFVVLTIAAGAAHAAPPPPLPCAAEALTATADIRTLLSVLGLPAGQLDALEAKLDAAEASIAKGNANATEGQLGALRNEVEALAANGTIAAADAQALLDAIDGTLVVVTTCSTTPRLSFFNVRSGQAENTLFWTSPAVPSYASTRVLFRTDTYPTGPNDPAATLLGTFPGAAGAVGSTAHSGLASGSTYYYAAFAEDGAGVPSSAKTSRGRPDDGPKFLWSYTVGRRLPIVAIPFPPFSFHVLSDDALHGMGSGPSGGGWPSGWMPVRIPAPAEVRPNSAVLPSPLTVGGTNRISLVSSRTRRLYTVNSETGAILWTSPDLGGALLHAPSASFVAFGAIANLVFVGVQRPDGSGIFYALNIADGSVAWTFDDGGSLGSVVTAPAVDNPASRVYFTSRARGGADTLWCLDFTATSATKLWSANPGDVNTSPTFRSTAVYVGNTAGEIHALHPITGAPNWTQPYNTGDGPVTLFVFRDVSSNRLYFSTANQVNAIADLGSSATPFWTEPLRVPSPAVPVPFSGKVYVPAADGRIHEIDASSPTPNSTILTVGDPAKPSALGQLTFATGQLIMTVGSADGVAYAYSVPFTP